MGKGIEAPNQFLKLPFSQPMFPFNLRGKKTTTTICSSLSICVEESQSGRRNDREKGKKKTDLEDWFNRLMSGTLKRKRHLFAPIYSSFLLQQ